MRTIKPKLTLTPSPPMLLGGATGPPEETLLVEAVLLPPEEVLPPPLVEGLLAVIEEVGLLPLLVGVGPFWCWCTYSRGFNF